MWKADLIIYIVIIDFSDRKPSPEIIFSISVEGSYCNFEVSLSKPIR